MGRFFETQCRPHWTTATGVEDAVVTATQIKSNAPCYSITVFKQTRSEKNKKQ